MQEFEQACEEDPTDTAAREGLALSYTEIGTRLKLAGHNKVCAVCVILVCITVNCEWMNAIV